MLRNKTKGKNGRNLHKWLRMKKNVPYGKVSKCTYLVCSRNRKQWAQAI
jgi:hypothetical protein